MKDEKKTRQESRDQEEISSTVGDDEKGGDMDTRPHFRNGAELSEYIGVDRRAIPQLVKHEGLPARKIRGKWQAVICDVRPWVIKRIRGK